MDQFDIDNRFAFHPATTEEKKAAHGSVRSILWGAANYLNSVVPDGREKSLMMTHLEDAMFWGNAGIARRNHADQ